LAEPGNDVTADVIDIAPEEELRVCLFTISGELFAIPVIMLTEILIPQKIFPVPTTPSFVLGVINLRGTIVPLIDVRPTLSLPPMAATGQIAVIKHDTMLLGIAVDNVSTVISVPESSVQPVPAGADQGSAGSRNRFIKGVIHQDFGRAALLDLEQVLDQVKLS
jgi:purine-binding chemotaxis protein CheW